MPAAEIGLVLEVRPDFEHGVLVDVGPVLVDSTELATAELGYLRPGRYRLRLANPTPQPAQLMLLGGVSFSEPILMLWNLVSRTHAEIARFREEWESGSERFDRDEGYRGRCNESRRRRCPRSTSSPDGSPRPDAAIAAPGDSGAAPRVMS